MNSKCVMLILDGLGDRSYPEFGHKTPLQEAHTPNLDKLSALGGNGLYHAGIPGQALPSEAAHFSLFGYSPSAFPGRGPLEALGGNLHPEPSDVALMARLVSLKELNGQLFLHKDKPSVDQSEVLELSNVVKDYEKRGIKLDFHTIDNTFGALILRGEASPYITDSDPLWENAVVPMIKPWEGFEDDPSTRNTCFVLNSYLMHCYKTLKTKRLNNSRKLAGYPPINGVVTQRAGRVSGVESFQQKWGLNGISVSSGTIYKGISRFLGLDFFESSDHSVPETEITRKLHEAYDFLDDYDFIHVHTKWPDKAAHTKDPDRKKQVIEGLDRGIGNVMDYFLSDPRVLLLVTADHSTPSGGRMLHSGEPVPLTFCGSGVRRDRVEKFDEIAVSSGAMGFLQGQEVMYFILNFLDRGKLKGLRDAPADNPYMAHGCDPLNLGDCRE